MLIYSNESPSKVEPKKIIILFHSTYKMYWDNAHAQVFSPTKQLHFADQVLIIKRVIWWGFVMLSISRCTSFVTILCDGKGFRSCSTAVWTLCQNCPAKVLSYYLFVRLSGVSWLLCSTKCLMSLLLPTCLLRSLTPSLLSLMLCSTMADRSYPQLTALCLCFHMHLGSTLLQPPSQMLCWLQPPALLLKPVGQCLTSQH